MATEAKRPTDLKDAAKAIQRAHKSGRKTVTIDGRDLKIKRLYRRVTFESGGVQYKTTEKWLLATPANGTLVPMFCVELDRQGNLRSALS